ncbi:hypothetical protein D3C87_1245850 [compost metagenome]
MGGDDQHVIRPLAFKVGCPNQRWMFQVKSGQCFFNDQIGHGSADIAFKRQVYQVKRQRELIKGVL